MAAVPTPNAPHARRTARRRGAAGPHQAARGGSGRAVGGQAAGERRGYGYARKREEGAAGAGAGYGAHAAAGAGGAGGTDAKRGE